MAEASINETAGIGRGKFFSNPQWVKKSPAVLVGLFRCDIRQKILDERLAWGHARGARCRNEAATNARPRFVR
jgi:hypothetical protein